MQRYKMTVHKSFCTSFTAEFTMLSPFYKVSPAAQEKWEAFSGMHWELLSEENIEDAIYLELRNPIINQPNVTIEIERI